MALPQNMIGIFTHNTVNILYVISLFRRWASPPKHCSLLGTSKTSICYCGRALRFQPSKAAPRCPVRKSAAARRFPFQAPPATQQINKALSWHVVASSSQRGEHTAFSVSPSAESVAKAFCRLFLWSFKAKNINRFLWHSHKQCGGRSSIMTFSPPASSPYGITLMILAKRHTIPQKPCR